jgi:hypothetical protein
MNPKAPVPGRPNLIDPRIEEQIRQRAYVLYEGRGGAMDAHWMTGCTQRKKCWLSEKPKQPRPPPNVLVVFSGGPPSGGSSQTCGQTLHRDNAWRNLKRPKQITVAKSPLHSLTRPEEVLSVNACLQQP